MNSKGNASYYTLIPEMSVKHSPQVNLPPRAALEQAGSGSENTASQTQADATPKVLAIQQTQSPEDPDKATQGQGSEVGSPVLSGTREVPRLYVQAPSTPSVRSREPSITETLPREVVTHSSASDPAAQAGLDRRLERDQDLAGVVPKLSFPKKALSDKQKASRSATREQLNANRFVAREQRSDQSRASDSLAGSASDLNRPVSTHSNRNVPKGAGATVVWNSAADGRKTSDQLQLFLPGVDLPATQSKPIKDTLDGKYWAPTDRTRKAKSRHTSSTAPMAKSSALAQVIDAQEELAQKLRGAPVVRDLVDEYHEYVQAAKEIWACRKCLYQMRKQRDTTRPDPEVVSEYVTKAYQSLTTVRANKDAYNDFVKANDHLPLSWIPYADAVRCTKNIQDLEISLSKPWAPKAPSELTHGSLSDASMTVRSVSPGRQVRPSNDSFEAEPSLYDTQQVSRLPAKPTVGSWATTASPTWDDAGQYRVPNMRKESSLSHGGTDYAPSLEVTTPQVGEDASKGIYPRVVALVSTPQDTPPHSEGPSQGLEPKDTGAIPKRRSSTSIESSVFDLFADPKTGEELRSGSTGQGELYNPENSGNYTSGEEAGDEAPAPGDSVHSPEPEQQPDLSLLSPSQTHKDQNELEKAALNERDRIRHDTDAALQATNATLSAWQERRDKAEALIKLADKTKRDAKRTAKLLKEQEAAFKAKSDAAIEEAKRRDHAQRKAAKEKAEKDAYLAKQDAEKKAHLAQLKADKAAEEAKEKLRLQKEKAHKEALAKKAAEDKRPKPMTGQELIDLTAEREAREAALLKDVNQLGGVNKAIEATTKANKMWEEEKSRRKAFQLEMAAQMAEAAQLQAQATPGREAPPPQPKGKPSTKESKSKKGTQGHQATANPTQTKQTSSSNSKKSTDSDRRQPTKLNKSVTSTRLTPVPEHDEVRTGAPQTPPELNLLNMTEHVPNFADSDSEREDRKRRHKRPYKKQPAHPDDWRTQYEQSQKAAEAWNKRFMADTRKKSNHNVILTDHQTATLVNPNVQRIQRNHSYVGKTPAGAPKQAPTLNNQVPPGRGAALSRGTSTTVSATDRNKKKSGSRSGDPDDIRRAPNRDGNSGAPNNHGAGGADPPSSPPSSSSSSSSSGQSSPSLSRHSGSGEDRRGPSRHGRTPLERQRARERRRIRRIGIQNNAPQDDRVPDHPPASWYLNNFPGRWAVAPNQPANNEELHRAIVVKHVPVFDGDPQAYHEFAQQVLELIHKTPARWSAKLAALTSLLDQKTPELEVIVNQTDWSPLRYIRIIRSLEERFGGAKLAISLHLERVRAIKPVVGRDLATLELLHMRAVRHRDLLTTSLRYTEPEMEVIFNEIHSRLSAVLSDEYLHAVDTTPDGTGFGQFKGLGLDTFIDYMSKKIMDWRAKLRYTTPILPPRKAIREAYKAKSAKAHVSNETVQSDDEDQQSSGSSHDVADAKVAEVHYGQQGADKAKKSFKPYKKFERQTSDNFRTQLPKNLQSKQGSNGARKPYSFTCTHCKEKHSLDSCEKFKKLGYQQKVDVLRKGNHCLRCFSTKHWAKNCPRDMEHCSRCDRKHHILICGKDAARAHVAVENESSETDQSEGGFDAQFEDEAI